MRKLIIEKANKNIGALCNFLNKNKEYLELVISNIPIEANVLTLSEKIWYFVNEIKEIKLCMCGNNLIFMGFKHGYRQTCGDKICYTKKRKETNIEKYGVDNPMKSKEIRDKSVSTLLEKYGVDSPMKSKEVQEKFKKTMIENHGVEWAQQSKEIQEKSINTYNNNIGNKEMAIQRGINISNKNVEEKEEIQKKRKLTLVNKYGSIINYNKIVQDKIILTSIEKYGTDHFFKNKEVYDKRISTYIENKTEKIENMLPTNIRYIDRFYNTNETEILIKILCIDCNNESTLYRSYLYRRCLGNINPCLICNPILSGRSQMEIDLFNIIKENCNVEVQSNIKIDNIEVDIYIPELKLAFEFNGLYWHSNEYKDKRFHKKKTDICKKNDIKLIHIWEDDWLYKNEIVKSRVLNLLNKSNKIYARKCSIKEVNNLDYRNFLNKNHIQGFVGAKIKLGLYYNDELVSVMSFGNLRKSLGQKSKDGSFELLRFANELNLTVIGGASKLFLYFIKKYKFTEIISYSDICWSSGDLYKKLGFYYLHTSQPNYYYVIDGVRKHRFNFRKSKLVENGADQNKSESEIMTELGYYKIYDCGNDKWIYKLNI